jgi:fluoride exporter
LIQKLILIGFAGALGTLSRYALAGAVQRWAGAEFPWGTFVVNVAGSLIFGFIWSIVAERFLLSPEVRLVILVGFMGAFTTFSTLMFESEQLIAGGEWMLAMLNVGGQVALGMIALIGGMALGRLV